MDTAEEINQELLYKYWPMSSHWGKATYIVDPGNFYIQPNKYVVLLNCLETTILTKEEITDVSVPQMVVFRSVKKGRIIRGQILSPGVKVPNERKLYTIDEVEPTKCEIHAFDYGFTEEVSKGNNNIYKCHDILLKFPPLALHCELHMSLPVGPQWSNKSINAFKNLIMSQMLEITVTHRILEKFIVIVKKADLPDNITNTMALRGYGMLRYVDPYVIRGRRGIIRKYSFKERGQNSTLQVRMLCGRNWKEFYAAEVNEYREFLQLKSDINFHAMYGKELEEIDIKKGLPVLFYDEENPNNSQRAMIEYTTKPKTTICFIDTGKRITAKKENIKHIPQKLLHLPGLAIYCSAKKKPRNIKLEEFIFSEREFKIRIEKVGSKLMYPNIVDVIVSRNRF